MLLANINNSNLLFVALLVVIVLCFPRWGYNTSWGYGPFGILLFIAIVLIFCRVFGVI